MKPEYFEEQAYSHWVKCRDTIRPVDFKLSSWLYEVSAILTWSNDNSLYLDSLLISAAEHGNIEAVKVLLAIGATPKAVRNDNATAIGLAAANGHKECVIWLKRHGAPTVYKTSKYSRKVYDIHEIAEQNGYRI